MKTARAFRNMRLLMGLGAICLFLASSSNTYAKPTSTFVCTASGNNSCLSWKGWNGWTYGGFTQFTIDDPGFYTDSAYYMKFLRLTDNTDNAHLDIGIIKSKDGFHGPYCETFGDPFVQYFVQSWDQNLNHLRNWCGNVPDADKNTEINFSAIYDPTCQVDPSVEDEMRVQIGNGSQFSECVDIEQQRYYQEVLQAQIVDTVTGHQVYGGVWQYTSWVASNLTFQYQNRAEDFAQMKNDMLMYWSSVPMPGNLGGVLRSCVYEPPIKPCNFGS